MSSPPESSSQFQSILDVALGDYKKKTGNDLLDSWLARELQTCDSAEAILDIIQGQAEAFDKFRNSDKRLMKWIGSSVGVLHKIFSILGEAAGTVTVRTIRDGWPELRCNIVAQVLPHAKPVFAGIAFLLAVRLSVFPFYRPFSW
jgi:hypothetical protein